MTETIQRKRVEILVDQPLVPRILQSAEASGIRGHTLLPTLSGAGASGAWSDDQLTGAMSKVLFVTVTTAEKAEALIERVAPLLDSYGLVLIASDVAVVRGGKF